MSRQPILGQLDRDLACAVALGIVENPRVAATLEFVTIHDQAMRQLGTMSPWLEGDDPLDILTREYLRAKRDATQAGARLPAQSGGTAAKARDTALNRAAHAWKMARQVLLERGALNLARELGLEVSDQTTPPDKPS